MASDKYRREAVELRNSIIRRPAHEIFVHEDLEYGHAAGGPAGGVAQHPPCTPSPTSRGTTSPQPRALLHQIVPTAGLEKIVRALTQLAQTATDPQKKAQATLTAKRMRGLLWIRNAQEASAK